MEPCHFCRKPIERDAVNTWRRVSGWVGGPKRNGFTLQSRPNAFACDECIRKIQAGHAPDEQAMEFE